MLELPTYSLTFEARGPVLSACVTAVEVTTHMVVEYTNKISGKLRETGLYKLLFIRRCPILRDPQNISMTAFMFRNSLHHSLKIAIVDEYGNDRMDREKSDHASTAAGFDTRSFPNASEALEWLDSPE